MKVSLVRGSQKKHLWMGLGGTLGEGLDRVSLPLESLFGFTESSGKEPAPENV
jgi:hypothetical protein